MRLSRVAGFVILQHYKLNGTQIQFKNIHPTKSKYSVETFQIRVALLNNCNSTTLLSIALASKFELQCSNNNRSNLNLSQRMLKF
jgi:hypothetical protein